MGRVIVGRVIVGRVIVGRVIVGRVNGYQSLLGLINLKSQKSGDRLELPTSGYTHHCSTD